MCIRDSPKAAIVRFTEKGADKTHYRAYNIPKYLGGNDAGSIIYALNKRLQHKNKPPSVILIDGGTQQLNASKKANNHQKICFLAMKKGYKRKALSETIYSLDGQEEISIRSDLFALLTKARDEAHRFAIKANRSANLKSIRGSKLDTISGIGPLRRTMLLQKFKSIDAIINAPVDTLISIAGITPKIAKEIKSLKE